MLTADQLNQLLSSGLHVINFAHDHDCPALFGHPEKCNCNPEVVIHGNEKLGVATLVQNRQQRRAAKRAARALAKARKS